MKSITISPQKYLPAYGLFLTIGAFVTLLILMATPSETERVFLFGLSRQRILLGLIILLLSIVLLFATAHLFLRPERSLHLWMRFTEHSKTGNTVFSMALFAALCSLLLVLVPDYRLGKMAGYINRLGPVINWLGVSSLFTSVVLLLARKRKTAFSIDHSVLKTAIFVMGLSIILGLFIVLTGLGIRYQEDYWYGAGVPALGMQILFAFLIGTFLLLANKKIESFNRKQVDLFFFIALWFFSAVFWAQESPVANYFMTENEAGVLYPYSDSATFDIGAQFALIGQGVFNGVFFERILYSIYLVYLHLLFGQDFLSLMSMQAITFAVLPAVIYLIGCELHSRALGLSAGVLTAFRGANAIAAAKWIDTASPKMLLTDFPAAIGIAVSIYLFLTWCKDPSRIGRLFWTGAALALTSMVRLNVLVLLPVFIAVIPFFFKLRFRQVVVAGLVALIGAMAVTLPWELRNQSRGFPMYSMYYGRFRQIFLSRYDIGRETEPFHMRSAYGSDRQRAFTMQDELCDGTLCSVFNHYMHNISASFLSLPNSPTLDDLMNTIKSNVPYWKQDWTSGSVTVSNIAFVFLNLGIISLGISSVWNRARKPALLLLLSLGVYLFSNAMALTSGGRYIVPIDWIVYILFTAGGLQAISWFLFASGFSADTGIITKPKEIKFPSLISILTRSLPVLAGILLLGILLPASEWFFEPRYQVKSPNKILAELKEEEVLEQTGFTVRELSNFIKQPQAVIREGRALYPRHYQADEGEPDRSNIFLPLEYPRIAFFLISPYAKGQEGVILPVELPLPSLHAEDVIVIGCWNKDNYASFIDVLILVAATDDGDAYHRPSNLSLKCPP